MKKKTSLMSKIHVVLVTLLLIAVIANVLISFSIQPQAQPVVDITTQIAETNKVSVTIIEPTNCSECTDMSEIAAALSSMGLEVEVETKKQTEAIDLITKHSLTKLPTMVLEGNAAALDGIPLFEKTDSGYVLRDVPPPYTDLDGNVVGLVTLIELTNTACVDCYNASMIVSQLESEGVKLVSKTEVDISSEEGKALVDKYKITKTPTIILSEDAKAYAFLADAWPTVGSEEADGNMVLRDIPAPYYDSTIDATKGLVNLVYLTDESCADCYDPETLKKIFVENLGITFVSEASFDISSAEGKRLLEKYNISLVPTLLLNSEAQAYPAIKATWEQLGTVEDDGMYVLRSLDAFGVQYNTLN